MSRPPNPTPAPPALPAPHEASGVDVSLIRWMLSLSPEERLAVLQGFTDSVAELTRARSST
jgi:hypothetical protein